MSYVYIKIRRDRPSFYLTSQYRNKLTRTRISHTNTLYHQFHSRIYTGFLLFLMSTAFRPDFLHLRWSTYILFTHFCDIKRTLKCLKLGTSSCDKTLKAFMSKYSFLVSGKNIWLEYIKFFTLNHSLPRQQIF